MIRAHGDAAPLGTGPRVDTPGEPEKHEEQVSTRLLLYGASKNARILYVMYSSVNTEYVSNKCLCCLVSCTTKTL